MNRKITCILLMTLVQPAFAAKLYRWHEADGSITFSPTPPAKGIPFETIGENTDGTKGLDKSAISSAIDQNTNPVAELPAEPVLTAKALRVPKAAPANTLTYAPASNALKPGITRAAVEELEAAPAQATTEIQPRNTSVASAKKSKQCEDLSKRVISLERRLRLDLSDEDMDNTVVHMARYQASFDQFCDA